MQAILAMALSLMMAFSCLGVALGEDARDLQSLGVGHLHMIYRVRRGFQEL